MDLAQLLTQLEHEVGKSSEQIWGVSTSVVKVLDRLPSSFSADLWQTKVDTVYQHIFDSYYGEGRSVYTSVAT